ncbi:MAG: septum formation inhibitor Maf [Proteobacteria bacterium]|nr:septum formation inhibitor Maf [Pseudomonadota bacterium]
MSRLILASASPRRRELLAWAGVDFEIRPVEIDESVRPGESPEAHVRRLAETKAEQASELSPNLWVLAADTVVVLGDRILGKPADRNDAARMLAALSGRTHRVLTGYCLIHRDRDEKYLDHIRTDVEFRALGREEIEAYLDSGEVWDKAGAYAIQGRGGSLVRFIQGSYTNVIGLPLAEVLDRLRSNGLSP